MHSKWSQLLLLAAATGMLDVAFGAPARQDGSTLSVPELDVASSEPWNSPIKRDPMFGGFRSGAHGGTPPHELPPRVVEGVGTPKLASGNVGKQQDDVLLSRQDLQRKYDDALLEFEPHRQFQLNFDTGKDYAGLKTKAEQEAYIQRAVVRAEEEDALRAATARAEANWETQLLSRPMSTDNMDLQMRPAIRKAFPQMEYGEKKRLQNYYKAKNDEFVKMEDPAAGAIAQQQYFKYAKGELASGKVPPLSFGEDRMMYQIRELLPKDFPQQTRNALVEKYRLENAGFASLRTEDKIRAKQDELLGNIKMLYGGAVVKGRSKRSLPMTSATKKREERRSRRHQSKE